MKLFEIASQLIDPSDIFLYQKIDTHDQEYIDGLVSTLQSGKQLEPIEVAIITDKLKNDVKAKIQQVRAKLTPNPQNDWIRDELKTFDALVTTKKKYVVMDGHHRVLAALKAKSDKISAHVSKNVSANEFGFSEMMNMIK